MKPIDLFEAMNDLPPDILLSAEARRSDVPARPAHRRPNLAQSGWFAAGISLFVALGVIVVLVKAMNHAPDSSTANPAQNGAIANATAADTTSHEKEEETFGYEVLFGYPSTAVPLAQLPDDAVYLSAGTWGAQPSMTLLSGDWIEDGTWVGIDADIDPLYFLDIEPTLYLEVEADPVLKLYLPDTTVQNGSFSLYHASGDGNVSLIWRGDRLSGWCLPDESGASRTLNVGVFYLTVPLTQFRTTVTGETETRNYEAAIRLVVTDRQPYQQETTGESRTGDETRLPLTVPDMSVPVGEISASDVFWWEIGDGTRGVTAGKYMQSCTIYMSDGQQAEGCCASLMDQFYNSAQPTISVTGDTLALKFHMPSETGYVAVRSACLIDESERVLRTYSLTDGSLLLERDDAGGAGVVFLSVSVLQYREPAKLPEDMTRLGLLDEYRFDILIRLIL